MKDFRVGEPRGTTEVSYYYLRKGRSLGQRGAFRKPVKGTSVGVGVSPKRKKKRGVRIYIHGNFT